MTLKEFLSDRLGRLVLQPVSMAVMAVFLLATGTPVSYTHLDVYKRQSLLRLIARILQNPLQQSADIDIILNY